MATSVRASSQNSATTGTALSVSAPTGTTTGDLVIVAAHANTQTTIVDNNHTVTSSNLTNGTDGTAGTSATTASITPSANKLITMFVHSRTNISTDPNQPTVTGNGLTWVAINSIVWDTTSSSRKRVTMFRTMGASPSSGAVTIDFAGQEQTNIYWIIDEHTGTDTSGTNGSGAIVQSATNKDEAGTSTSLTVTLAAFSDTNNATYGGFICDNVQGSGAVSVGSGFSQIGTYNEGAALTQLITELKPTNDISVDVTNGTTGANWGGIAIEIKANSGFTEQIDDYKPNTTSGHVVSLFSRVIQAGDPTTYNFTSGASGQWSLIAVTFQNPHADKWDVAPSTTNAQNLDSPPGSSGATAKTITTLTNNAIHCALAFIDSSIDDFTGWPSGYTVHQSVDNNQGQTFTTKVIASPSATGAQSFTHNGTGTAYIALSFSVKDSTNTGATPATGFMRVNTGFWGA